MWEWYGPGEVDIVNLGGPSICNLEGNMIIGPAER